MTMHRQWRASALVALLLGAATAMVTVVRLYADTIPNEGLFRSGKQALEQGNYADTLMYLFAYLQRAPATLQNAEHAQQVEDAIRFSREQLQYVADQKRQLEVQVSNLQARLGEPHSSVAGMIKRPRLDDPTGTVALAEPSYPLACRGGGGMSVQLASQGLGLTGPRFIIEFRRAASAGAGALAPGECAWLDRPVGANEPDRICHGVDASRLQISWLLSDSGVQSLTSPTAPYLAHLTTGEISTFEVFNNGNGCLVATRVPYATRIDPRARAPITRPRR